MKDSSSIGSLMYLYLDEIEITDGTNAPDFLIKAAAKQLQQKGGRNWLPVIVKILEKDKYQVVGNSFGYAVAEQAGLERVWCIIADDTEDTTSLTKILAREETPKLNLSTASREEINSALQFLIEQPNSPLKTIKLAVATSRIDEAPRQYWKNFEPIINLKCGITKGKKLDSVKDVFYLTPQDPPPPPDPPPIDDLIKMTVAELKSLAKEMGITGISKMRKNDLIEAIKSIRV
ncbi:MAG: Rho termination factor N-terminal domain-containing protein [Microcoleaceae cyanobacterium]